LTFAKDKELQAISDASSTRSTQMWADRTPEEREAIGQKISQALSGREMPQETRDKISATLKGHHYHDSDSEAVKKWREWAETEDGKDALRRGAFASSSTEYTSIEIAMYKSLDELGIPYIPQYIVAGKFRVDAYLPDIPLILEAWGTFYHADPRSGKYDRNDIDSLYPIQKSNVHQDSRKEKYFAKVGIPIVSIWGTELNDDPVQAVLNALQEYIQF